MLDNYGYWNSASLISIIISARKYNQEVLFSSCPAQCMLSVNVIKKKNLLPTTCLENKLRKFERHFFGVFEIRFPENFFAYLNYSDVACMLSRTLVLLYNVDSVTMAISDIFARQSGLHY